MDARVPISRPDSDRATALRAHLDARLLVHQGTRPELAEGWRVDVPPVLYHYTTAEGLLGILNEQAFWATDCEFLNDSSEMRYGLRLLDHTLREFAVQGEHSLALRGQVIKDGRGFRPGKKPFVVCFCKRGDLLSQWHGYAGGGGYAIGLAWTGIAASICNSNCALWQVEYDVDHQTEILTAHFEAAAIAAEEVMSECQSTEEEDIVSALRATPFCAVLPS